jgi:hypothetical protein
MYSHIRGRHSTITIKWWRVSQRSRPTEAHGNFNDTAFICGAPQPTTLVEESQPFPNQYLSLRLFRSLSLLEGVVVGGSNLWVRAFVANGFIESLLAFDTIRGSLACLLLGLGLLERVVRRCGCLGTCKARLVEILTHHGVF